MNIVITHTDFRLYWPARIAALNKLLQKNGHSLHVIEIAGKGSPYFFDKKTKMDRSINCTCLFPERKMETISGKEASQALWNKLEKINPDVVLSGAIAFPSGATAVRWCRAKNKRVVIFDNARLNDVPRSWFVNFIKQRIYASVDAMLIPAKSHEKDFQYWGFNEKQVFYGLNVIDNQWFSEHSPKNLIERTKLRNKLNLPESFFLGVGRFVKKKNWNDVLLAYDQICQNINKPPALVLVGDGPEKQNLKKIIETKKIEKVIFKSFVSQEKICSYYSFSELLILASSSGETWGLVVNEAMACSLPVIVSKQCGCASTLVNEGENGFSFSAGNITELASKMTTFINLSNDTKKRMGEYSKNIINDWSLDRFAQGAWEAIQYSIKHPKKKKNVLDALIIKSWNGRYRPT
jgi:glycosyltransferase involved in cell wall biosynthesis